MSNLTQLEITQFQNDGYVILDNILPLSDIERHTSALRNIIRHHIKKVRQQYPHMPSIPEGEEFNTGMTELDKVNHSSVAEIYDTLACMPEGFRLTSNSDLTRCINQTLGDKPDAPLFATQCNALLFMPHDREHAYTWHKDIFYTVPDSKFVQIWAPLVQDSTDQIGTLVVCPGSQKDSWRGQVEVAEGLDSHRYKYQVPDNEVSKYTQLKVPMKLGQAMLFHPGLIHRSGDNVSDTCRFSLVGLFHKVTHPSFRPLLLHQHYVGKTPDDYFNDLYGKE